jgi:transcriptional regulator with XRE-family HTH domain
MRTLEQAIGGELRRRREASGVRQESLAYTAQKLGLGWTQSTVAAIEGGRRSLWLGEFGMLPLIATESGVFISRVLDLIPDTDEMVVAAPGLNLPLFLVRSRYGTEAEQENARPYTLTEKRHVVTEAERKAARRLPGVSPEDVLRAAVNRWGRGLADERDQRIGPRAETLGRRSLQAVRGRVTRGLVSELEPIIKRRRRR